MKSEIQFMYDNQVWNFVYLTAGIKTVGSKWIFKMKTAIDGNVHMFKARLVVKGYAQTQKLIIRKPFHQ